MKMNGYKFQRAWHNFVSANPGKVKAQHHSLYHFIIETCNRLGWKKSFGLPTIYAMEGSSIGNQITYRKTFNDLIEWGFIKLIQKSKNQHTANIIALCETEEAKTSAMDRALMNHCNSSEDIVKPQTNKTLNNKKLSEIDISEVPNEGKKLFKYALVFHEVILNNAKQKNVPLKKVENATYSSWINPLKQMVEKDNVTVNHLKKMIEYLKNPDNEFWRRTILDSKGLRRNCSKILSEINSKSILDGQRANSNETLTKKLESYE